MKINEECIGCGACLTVCPFNAIELNGEKAVITEACTACSACVNECPVHAIIRDEYEQKIKLNKEEYKDVWVFLELSNGRIRNVGLELLGQGRKLADFSKQRLAAVIVGNQVEKHSKEAFTYGADIVYLVEDPLLSDYSTDGFTKVFEELIEVYKPAVLLLGATSNGRDLGPRLACRVSTGLTADCTGLDIDEATGLVAWTRPAFGGNIMATIICPEHRPQMGTVRPAVFKKLSPDFNKRGECILFKSKVKESDIRTTLVKTLPFSNESVNLEEADVIVSGGYGIGHSDNFRLVEELAQVMGGVVGASRKVVDAGWIDSMHQVGQTGKTVAPRVYIACGISGAIQHLAGISTSENIIAINNDQNAPIFSMSNFGIIGDVQEILPILTKELKEFKNSSKICNH